MRPTILMLVIILSVHKRRIQIQIQTRQQIQTVRAQEGVQGRALCRLRRPPVCQWLPVIQPAGRVQKKRAVVMIRTKVPLPQPEHPLPAPVKVKGIGNLLLGVVETN